MFRQSIYQFFTLTVLALSFSTFCMDPTSLSELRRTGEASRYTPENTKFAFDFHDVVAKGNPYRIFNGLLNRNIIPEISWDLPYNTAHALYNLPWVAYETALLAYNKANGEQFYDLYKRNGYDRIAFAVKTISNDLDAIDGTVAIIKELKDKGYQIDMASDIGTSFLKDLESQIKFISILNLFEQKKSVDYLDNPHAVHKPNKQYFVDYQNAYNLNNKKVIFIDDKQKNVSASEQADMIGIQFQNPKQLRNELVKRGILEEKQS